ncbi:MAG: hypothetical protein E2590_13835 [Chryseobacterium sp.]|nr:hypothetical protein [Chryseobacterium sp.]
MSKFLPQKKKLIEDVFEKASNEATEKSFSGILKSLERTLYDDFKITLSYNTFKTYYNYLVEKDEDYNIKPLILDDLSIYLGYNNFKEYCAGWKTVEYSIREAISKIVINVIIKMPEFLTKQTGMGFLGVLLVGGMFIGGKLIINDKTISENQKSQTAVGIMDYSTMKNDSAVYYETEFGKEKNPATQIIRVVENSIHKPKEGFQHYMYWNGERFVATTEASLGGQFEVIPMDEFKFKFFRKIMQPDTITARSLKKVWYSKKDNVVEFFTADGKNPENDAELRQLTSHILNKYILSNN